MKKKISRRRGRSNGASMLVDALEAHGVKYVFGVPGASIIPILDVLKDRGPEFVVCRHEQNAAFMAQAWGRLTGTPGVCMATVGPGATNLATGIATATADRDPVIAITGQTPRGQTFQTRHQNIDSAALFEPITKWSVEIDDADAVGNAVAQAFRTAAEPRAGACHLAFPLDVLQSPAHGNVFVRAPEKPGAPGQKEIRRAAALLAHAKRPVVFAGVESADAHSTEGVRTFLRETGMPALGTFEAAGVVGRKLIPQFLGRVGLSADEGGDQALRDADVVLTIGYDTVEYAPAYWKTRAKIIHIDRLPAEVDPDYAPEVELLGDIADSLARLLDAVGEERWTLTMNQKRIQKKLWKEQEKGSTLGGSTIHPSRLIAELRSVLRDEDLLISDVGSHQVWLARQFFAHEPRTLFFSMGFQTMGVALPWAIAARMAEPKRRIISCSGDGSFLMTMMDLETAVRRKLPFVHLVWRDGTYNLVEIQQMMLHGRTHGTKFNNPDIVKLAESFGATGMRISKPSHIKKTLERALRIRGPVVIDIPVDYRRNVGLLGKGGLFGN